MNKKLFVLLVVLMSLSLIGIIFVQIYWINQSINDKEEQFFNIVSGVLDKVTDNIEERERRDYFAEYEDLKDSVGVLKKSHIRDFGFYSRDVNTNKIEIYSHGILEEDYDIAATFFDNGLSAEVPTVKNFTSTRTKITLDESAGLDGSNSLTAVDRLEKVGGLTSVDKAVYEDVFKEFAKTKPIHKRVSRQEIELLLDRELKNRGVTIDFEYGIYSNGLPTKVKSKWFKLKKTTVYKALIFKDSEGFSDFSLLLNFPKKEKFLIRHILGMGILSLVFTLVIIVAYSSAIYQIIKQKQIAVIKADFINNMTHEFKTPIATINLAVEAIKNPKIIVDKEKVFRYLQMIKDENKRMHAQVENVLRISQLDKKQLDISKVRVDVHDIIEDAVTHVQLIVADRGGYVNVHLNAERSDVLANEMHFTNVIVNMLDNAVKYSPEVPKVDVYTELANKFLIVKIVDQGQGMSKSVVKKVFEKFYREHTGNIHNVKGHGLGLTYVKQIIDDHQGEVYAESEKGKGSTFYIKMPLI
ncbi:MAG: HAMP domain-containing sensor histidine kinase [Cellulophaga sp.]